MRNADNIQQKPFFTKVTGNRVIDHYARSI